MVVSVAVEKHLISVNKVTLSKKLKDELLNSRGCGERKKENVYLLK